MNTEYEAVVVRHKVSTRTRLNRVRKISFFMAVIGFLLYVAGSIWCASPLFGVHISFPKEGILIHTLSPFKADGVPLAIGGTVVMGCAVLARILEGRCGACNRRLSRALSWGGGLFAISRSFRFCPYCSSPIDALEDESQRS